LSEFVHNLKWSLEFQGTGCGINLSPEILIDEKGTWLFCAAKVPGLFFPKGSGPFWLYGLLAKKTSFKLSLRSFVALRPPQDDAVILSPAGHS